MAPSVSAFTPLDLSDFPNSPYAKELQQGVTGRRFAPPVEREFVSVLLARTRRRVRTWFSFEAVRLALTALGPAWAGGSWSAEIFLYLGVLVPGVGLLNWLAWGPRYERWYLPVAGILVPLMNVVEGVLIARAMVHLELPELMLLPLLVIAPFFLMGLLLRTAVFAVALLIVSFGSSALYLGLPHEDLLRLFAFLAAAAIAGTIGLRDYEENHRMSFLEVRLVVELATRDGLTRLKNRRAFDEHLRKVWQQAQRDRQPLALILIDVDHFKRFNDSHGHQAGDAALRHVAETVRTFARRPLDITARYGGEELAVILYDCDAYALQDVAERIRHSVEALGIEHRDSPTSSVLTVSIGGACVQPGLHRSPEGAVQLADQALYEAKEAGRNRVQILGPEEHGKVTTGIFDIRAFHRARATPGRHG